MAGVTITKMSTNRLVSMNRITHIFTTTLLLTLANLMVAITRSPADIQPKVTAPQHPPPSVEKLDIDLTVG